MAREGMREVAGAPPGDGAAGDGPVRGDVVAEGDGEEVEARLQVVELDADGLVALVRRGPHVAVLAVAVATQQLHRESHHLVHAVARVHHQDLRGVDDALEVLARLEQVELLVVGVPVGPDALEDGRPVEERVGHDADLGVGQPGPAPFEPALRVVLRTGALPGGVRVARGSGRGRLLGQHGREYRRPPAATGVDPTDRPVGHVVRPGAGDVDRPGAGTIASGDGSRATRRAGQPSLCALSCYGRRCCGA